MMVDTFIQEKVRVRLRNPILIGGFPGLGHVGKISISYLVKQWKAQKLADLYSPYFPHHVIVSSSGRVRLPRAEFYFLRNPKNGGRDLILLTGDSQAQGFEGQYNVVNKILEFAEQNGVQTVITVGGYLAKSGLKEPKVVSVSLDRTLLNRMIEAGAELSPAGNPIVGIAGVILGLAKFRKMEAACLLGETIGHMPDPRTAKAVLKVLQSFLGVELDLSYLDGEIEKSRRVFERMEDIQREMDALTKERAEIEGRKITYIS